MANYFQDRIRQLRKENGLTQQEVAKALGVGQTTVANYENGTRLPDFEKLSAFADLYQVTSDYLLGRSMNIRSEAPAGELTHKDKPIEKEIAEAAKKKAAVYKFSDYMDCLNRCDKKKAVEILLSLLATGTDADQIYRDFLERGLREAGDLWERGDLPVWKEHCISEISLEAMALIKERTSGKNYNKKTLLALVPGAESHSIGLRMISDQLEAQGFRVIFLGNNIPADNIIQAIGENKPEAVLLSVTMRRNVDTVQLIIEKIKQSFGTKAPAILVGGGAFKGIGQVENITGADKYCETYQDVVRTLNRI